MTVVITKKKRLLPLSILLASLALAFHGHVRALPTCGSFMENPQKNQSWLLPGEAEISLASARPAAKVYFLLRAAALDCYAVEKAELLDTEPVLKNLVQQALQRAIAQVDFYDHNFSPVLRPAEEQAALDAWLAEGYNGRWADYLRRYRAALASPSPSAAVKQLGKLVSFEAEDTSASTAAPTDSSGENRGCLRRSFPC